MNDLFAWFQTCRAVFDQTAGPDYLRQLAGRLPRLFRYHLAWCGDPLQAQTLTETTVRLALRWHAGFRMVSSGRSEKKLAPSLDAWFFGLARYTRNYLRSRRAPADTHSDAFSSTPLPGLAFVARLAAVFAHLPKRTSESLTLAFFACLSQPEIGMVLGMKPERIQPLLVDGLRRLQVALSSTTGSLAPAPLQEQAVAALETIFDAGSDAIQPDPAWLQAMQQRLLTASPVRSTHLPAWLPGPAFRRIFNLRATTAWGLRLAPVIIVLAIAIAWCLNGQPAPDRTTFVPALPPFWVSSRSG